MESQHCSNSWPLKQKNLIPCGIPVKCRQNCGHPAVLTSGETGGITVEFDKNISEIPTRFRWTSGRISKRIHHKIPLENLDKFPGRIQVDVRCHSGGIPPGCHWNSAGLTSKETAKIPADVQQKIHRKSTRIPLKFHRKIRTNFSAESKRNSGGIPPGYQWYYGGIPDILLDLPAGKPAGFRQKFLWHFGAFFSWEALG